MAMRSTSVLAALLIIILVGAGTAHAVNACSVGSSHVGHCDHSQARPACCQIGDTAPLASRLDKAGDRAQVVSAVTARPVAGAEIVNTTAKSRTDDPPFDRFSRLRLHLVLATLIV